MPTPIQEPAKYVTPVAIGFADQAGNFSLVSATTPLPATGGATTIQPAAPLSGSTGASDVVGPFAPGPGLPILLELTGSWQGTVRLKRSIDDGLTKTGLTAGGQPWAVFTGNANEPVWQENNAGATFWLDVALASGTVAYRLSQ